MVLFLNLPAFLELIIGVVVFVVLFVLIAVLTRTINKTDVKNVLDIVNSLGPLRGILNLFVSLVEKLINIFQR